MNDLAEVFTKIKDITIMKKFMNEILTDAERKDLNLRWELMQKLQEQTPQREISSQLGVSLCKITRGAKILKDSESVSFKILNKKTDFILEE